MKCLCCGKEIKENATIREKESCWHNKCVKSFFGTKVIPLIDISEEQLEKLANTTVSQGLTVPGVQKKLSLHLSEDADTRLTIVNYPTGYILKPQTEEFDSLPEFEALAMKMAQCVGIQVVPNALMNMNGRYAYITKRIDREREGDALLMYAMEDFCQLANRLTQDKYRGSYELCGRIIKKYSIQPGLDLSELFLRVVFSFVTGNSDMHLKNFSLIEKDPGGREYCLSQAYDMLPVNIILPEDKEQLALSLNGKKRNIRKKDFMVFAENCGIPIKSAEKIVKKVCQLEEKLLSICDESYLNDQQKKQTKELIKSRMTIFQ